MPTPTRAKPPVPAWIIRERKRLGLKPRDLAERLSAAGLPVTEGTVRTWEAGRNPHPDNVEGLERIFGTRSPDHMAEAGRDTLASADLIRALQDQTQAISELAAAVKALVEAQPAPTELATALVELVRSGLLAGSTGEAVADGPRFR